MSAHTTQQKILNRHRAAVDSDGTARRQQRVAKQRQQKVAKQQQVQQTLAELAAIRDLLVKSLAERRRAEKKSRKARKGRSPWAGYPGGDPRRRS